MKTTIDLLNAHPQVSGYKINITQKESCELFFVKGKLETVRRTDTCDKEVTIYTDHDGFKGDAQFFIYPSTTDEQLKKLIDEGAAKALLINNQDYTLPAAEEGSYTVESSFGGYSDLAEPAAVISRAVFAANTVEGASLNSVEIFVNRHTETVMNSRGLHKVQQRYDAMVEAIPTYNGEKQSVELYEQHNFSSLDEASITEEIGGKLAEVKARYEATPPQSPLACPVVLNRLELSELFANIAYDLNYAAVYSHTNLHKKGDAIQKAPAGDLLSVRMAGEVTGSVYSSKFDSDGMALTDIRIVEDGKAVNYFGANRFGQYLGETPTGNLRCICVSPGSVDPDAPCGGPWLEVLSMSGLQVDFYNDYIGGEIRLAYYHDGDRISPITGVSMAGSLSAVLSTIRLSRDTVVYNGYSGPSKAVLQSMNIF